MQTIVLIPALEPDMRLVSLSRELSDKGMVVVVVNDGSGPQAEAAIRAAGEHATVLAHKKNLGKGAALKTGLGYIASAFAGPYTVVCADADGQHRPQDIERVACEAATHPNALVLGTRCFEGKVPLRSRLGNTLMGVAFRATCGTNVHDTQTGLRAFSNRSVAWMCAVDGTRYEYEMNVLVCWAQEGRPLRQVGIATVYIDDNRDSHFDGLRDSLRVAGALVRNTTRPAVGFAASSLGCFVVDYALFCLLGTLLAPVLPWAVVVANVVARVASASLNYLLNRRLVFGDQGSWQRSAVRYAALAVAQLVGDTALVQALVVMGMSLFLAKPLSGTLLFVMSYIVQRTLVFGTGKKRDERNDDHEEASASGRGVRPGNRKLYGIRAA